MADRQCVTELRIDFTHDMEPSELQERVQKLLKAGLPEVKVDVFRRQSFHPSSTGRSRS